MVEIGKLDLNLDAALAKEPVACSLKEVRS